MQMYEDKLIKKKAIKIGKTNRLPQYKPVTCKIFHHFFFSKKFRTKES